MPIGIRRRTWVIGDSIVGQASTGNVQLAGGGEVYWSGVSGAKLAGITGRLSRTLHRAPYPTTLILALGTNEIFRSNLGNIRARIRNALMSIRQLLPNTRLIWSCVLPRRIKGEHKGGCGRKCIKNINKCARQTLEKLGNAHVIRHSHNFNPSDEVAYKLDGLHLEVPGQERFRQNLSQALVFFNNNPSVLCWPVHPADNEGQ